MISFISLLADANGGGWGHMGGGWMWAIPMMIFFMFFMMFFMRGGCGPRRPSNSTMRDSRERAREILAERYAKGELSTEEYRERTAELE